MENHTTTLPRSHRNHYPFFTGSHHRSRRSRNGFMVDFIRRRFSLQLENNVILVITYFEALENNLVMGELLCCENFPENIFRFDCEIRRKCKIECVLYKKNISVYDFHRIYRFGFRSNSLFTM